MTHEQKPESAEFRTREDQYNDSRFKRELECEIHIATGCRVTVYAEKRPTGFAQCSTYDRWVGHWSTPNWHYPVKRLVSVEEMERAVSEAEARGAAEQRQKDAEGMQTVGWGIKTEMIEGKVFSVWPRAMAQVPEWNIPLYTRPANVAALEDRVKELEGALAQSAKRAFNHGYLIACCNISHLHDEPSIARDVLAECGLSAVDISAIELSDYDAKALAEIRVSRGDQDPIRSGEQL